MGYRSDYIQHVACLRTPKERVCCIASLSLCSLTNACIAPNDASKGGKALLAAPGAERHHVVAGAALRCRLPEPRRFDAGDGGGAEGASEAEGGWSGKP